jgi:hypothetical protein
MEISKARYEADLKRFKLMEAEKIEAENMEIVKIIRGLNLTIPELHDFRENMKNMHNYSGQVEAFSAETVRT